MMIRLTAEMTAEEMQPLWPGIIRCLEIYCARFPDDETVENIITQCAAGRRQLWIVQDETGRVVLTPITEVVRNDATGAVRLVCCEVGGERLQECLPLLDVMEQWAKEVHGATESELVGRRGWERLLKPHAYELAAQIYRKRL
jgi:hypothetical protein